MRSLDRVIPCSDPAQQRHNIIRNRLALVGQESMSGVTAETATAVSTDMPGRARAALASRALNRMRTVKRRTIFKSKACPSRLFAQGANPRSRVYKTFFTMYRAKELAPHPLPVIFPARQRKP